MPAQLPCLPCSLICPALCLPTCFLPAERSRVAGGAHGRRPGEAGDAALSCGGSNCDSSAAAARSAADCSRGCVDCLPGWLPGPSLPACCLPCHAMPSYHALTVRLALLTVHACSVFCTGQTLLQLAFSFSAVLLQLMRRPACWSGWQPWRQRWQSRVAQCQTCWLPWELRDQQPHSRQQLRRQQHCRRQLDRGQRGRRGQE